MILMDNRVYITNRGIAGRIQKAMRPASIILPPRVKPIGSSGQRLKILIITGSEEIEPDANRWRYSFVEGKFDKDEEQVVLKEGGITSTIEEDDFADPLYNLLESHNDGDGYEGVGIVVGEDIETGGYIEMLPLMNDLPVPAWRQDGVWMCAVPNALEYHCEESD